MIVRRQRSGAARLGGSRRRIERGGGERDGSIDDGPSSTADASADASDRDASCGVSDTTPCGCGAGKTCCVFADGRSLCQPVGNEDPDAGCGSMNTLRCVAGTCAPGQACCFNGDVTDDDVCPKRITLRDSECVDVAGTPANAVCRDQSSGIQHHIMCQVDEDCVPYGATCQQARMDHVGRLMGICVR